VGGLALETVVELSETVDTVGIVTRSQQRVSLVVLASIVVLSDVGAHVVGLYRSLIV
jgi:hypothetical protein